MMLIPRGNYGLNLLDDFFNDPFFTSSSEKQEPARKDAHHADGHPGKGRKLYPGN